MPKPMQYSKGSIVYFEGDNDDRIFILQSGSIVLTSTDVETGETVSEQLKSGEFFGVKSALGHFNREETATVTTDSTAVALTSREFEILFSQNKQLIMKMLRVFSNQLRNIHKKIETLLHNVPEDLKTGLLKVARSFFEDEQYRSASDVYEKYLKRFPEDAEVAEIAKPYRESKLRAERIAAKNQFIETVETGGNQSALASFSLPAFARFAKTYEPGQVIIAEFEPGETFYLIQKGNVQLVKCVNGIKKNLDILKPGELFGEMAILDKSPRSATCVADGKVQCLEFNKDNFESLITGNPQLALMLLKLFCKRIYDQKRRLKILVLKDLQARIADVFLMLNEMNPIRTNTINGERKFNVTIADVAHWAGLDSDTTRDELNKFVSHRKILIYDDYMIINDINEIRRYYETRKTISSS